ncbi:MAG: Fe-S cluster assembly ATPase SufC [Candidatus Ureaplasma intestinipullorum]|uniref:Fe-S cluster assembly ATPase SufC n=1 Tax=Candidatus Ureaplasma intestinipullorum TaxID=2838770 RepID=A0A9E2KW67_9BACT|nr:Fe-S cluster assembly ATPase SufC [Candidatus Ureaplasma intestinipullorum]
MNTLKLENFNVEIGSKKILNNINLEIKKGDVVAILGPNGHGKSTLLKSILKHYDTTISSGKIFIDNLDVTNSTTDEIAKNGIYYACQHPIEIPGLKTIELLRNELEIKNKKISIIDLYKNVNKNMENLSLKPEILERSINENFSGGERKKTEILQMQVINPDFIFLDEIDSGLDIDAVNSISNVLIEQKNNNKTIVFITHNEQLLNNLKPNKVILIMNGEIVKISDISLAHEINNYGYEEIAKKLDISIFKENDDEFLKNTLKEYKCHGK